jgi:HSP20 family molecular chaperone IbpA
MYMNDEARKFFESLNMKTPESSPISPDGGGEPQPAPLPNPSEGGGADAVLARANATVSRRTQEREEVNTDEEGQLTIDVYQTTDDIVVQSPIAGVDPDEVDVEITTDSVTIRGKREQEQKVRTENYIYQECFWGRFARSVSLPQEIDPDRADAHIKNGVLTIIMPKIKKTERKKLKVNKRV